MHEYNIYVRSTCLISEKQYPRNNIPAIIIITLLYFVSVLQRSTFQCVLATDGQSTFVIFLYADGGIEWDFPGQVGLNAGDGIRFFSHPDSFSSRLTNIHTTSNVGNPGVWIFKVDGEEVVPAGCSNENNSEHI